MIASAKVLSATFVLGAFLVAASVSDVFKRKVSNQLNLAIFSAGVGFIVLISGFQRGIIESAVGTVVALLIWFPMFAARLMGAGDVKLFAACGAWLGWEGVVTASVAAGLLGAVLGALWLLRSRGAIEAANTVASAFRDPMSLRMTPFDKRERVPYALAICGGVLGVWLNRHPELLAWLRA